MMQRAFCWMLMLGMWGCGGGASDAPAVAPTGGVVNFNGQPLAKATLTFHPEKGPVGVAVGNEKGEFRVKTNGSDGAIPGPNKVTVTTAESTGPPPPADGNVMKLVQKPTVPQKYAKAATTDLIVTVPADGDLNLKLDLTK